MSLHMMEIHKATVDTSMDSLMPVCAELFVVSCRCGWSAIEEDLPNAQMAQREHRERTANRHLITISRAEVINSDYHQPTAAPRWLAMCSCGWVSVRQIRSAASNQGNKHRQEAVA